MRRLLKVTALALPLAVLIGSACALFLVMLEWATEERLAMPELFYLLPLGGMAMVAAYHHWGKGLRGLRQQP